MSKWPKSKSTVQFYSLYFDASYLRVFYFTGKVIHFYEIILWLVIRVRKVLFLFRSAHSLSKSDKMKTQSREYYPGLMVSKNVKLFRTQALISGPWNSVRFAIKGLSIITSFVFFFFPFPFSFSFVSFQLYFLFPSSFVPRFVPVRLPSMERLSSGNVKIVV